MFAKIATFFFRGLLVVVPIGLTLWVLYFVANKLDRLLMWALERITGQPSPLELPVPGFGLIVTVALVSLVGLLASTAVTRWVFRLVDQVFHQLPLVRILYGSIKDLIGAFVGDKKSFNTPVVVESDMGVHFLGFQTRDDLGDMGLADHVAVYFPQSYNFAGNVLVVPRSKVRPVEVDATLAMTFIVSGGVSGGPLATDARGAQAD